ncbi:MAG: methyltetrahydrofolate cobalamin methyltransferase [Firmicutes bacterium]|nr:methyltetrahydrofolate cobalamin methyltransferase [Bacillota bacterium]
MLLVGERINGLFKDVARAIQERNPEPIRALAVAQRDAGAHFLDINTGPAVEDPVEVMGWLVKTAQEAVDLPISIDSMNIEAIRAGLRVHKGRALINSTTGERAKLEAILPLVKEHNAYVIGLAMNEKGVPKDANDRCAIAMEIVAAADEYGIPTTDLFIDPLILPVSVAQEHAVEVLETIRQVKLLADPPPRTLVGLSNVSQKTKNRSLVNRVFLVMAMAAGLDGAILDVTDAELMDAMATARILLNKEVYCDSYLQVARRAGGM